MLLNLSLKLLTGELQGFNLSIQIVNFFLLFLNRFLLLLALGMKCLLLSFGVGNFPLEILDVAGGLLERFESSLFLLNGFITLGLDGFQLRDHLLVQTFVLFQLFLKLAV